MFEKSNKYKLLKVFLFFPTDSFRLRELSRLSGIPPSTALHYLNSFEKEGLIKRYTKRGVIYYAAERENPRFKLYQKLSIQLELEISGLVEYLWNELSPKAIILYGSFARGEAVDSSDIDIFIIGNKCKIDLTKYESYFQREIHLMFEKDLKHVPKHLKNNLINGVVLRGYLKM